ncbi:MAG: hypothetical protein JETCAE01_25130 [Anaerolineaceae bacterium]|nr:MAG: hypothetical protein JETCAE01_25130 [Anaerolineaceae bacterium]
MIKKTLFFTLALFLVLAACGPSPEEIATMTASAWTATPTITPSPTPTPIPYDLSVKITDADGNAIAGSSVTLGESDPVLTDANGLASWTNLPEPDGTLAISAQGYFASEQTFNLNRGPNDLTFTLERDPNGLLPSQACAPGESLLYIEDFQDGSGQGWPEIEYFANGWLVEEFAAEPGNLVASNNNMEHHGHSLEDVAFEDAVWRVRFFVNGRRLISFNWLQNFDIEIDGQQINNSRYQIVVDTDGIGIRRLTLPVMNIGAASGRGAKAENWHTIEISTFQGRTEVWLDGQKNSGYTDPKPLPGGGLGLELITFDTAKPDTIIYFDNMSVCGLSAPFTSMFVAP